MEPAKVRKYDLEMRTHQFSKAVRDFLPLIPQTMANAEDAKQLIRSSGSVCGNYIEACAAVSKKDFVYRIKICRKEAKESWHWLDNLFVGDAPALVATRDTLRKEALELVYIFAASIRTIENSPI